jgi:hypothetical protein
MKVSFTAQILATKDNMALSRYTNYFIMWQAKHFVCSFGPCGQNAAYRCFRECGTTESFICYSDQLHLLKG